MSDQPKPMSRKLQGSSFNRTQAMKILMGATVGGSLLGLAGLTLTGTMTAFLVAIPGLVLLSPILIPAGFVLALVTTGFLFSGGLLTAALAVMMEMYRYAAGRRLPWVAEVDYGRMKFSGKGEDVMERAKETTQEACSRILNT